MNGIFSIIQINSIGIILMIITLFSLIKNLKSGILADKLFFWLAFLVMTICFLEILCSVFNKQTFYGAILFNRIFNSILFAFNPIAAYIWALYANCKIFKNEELLKKSYKLLSIPLIIVVLLSFLNLFIDVFFTITDNNVYQRTNMFFVSTLLSVFYLIYVIVIVILKRKETKKELYLPLLSFMVLPLIGLIIQFTSYGVSMLWVCAAISVIIIFNYVQNDISITDWLTGLYNRRHLDNYLQQMCKRKRTNILAGLMIDIDCFKKINDTYGHLIGDQALKDISQLLKNTLSSKTYISRYAGDEFVVVLEIDNVDKIKDIIKKIHNEIINLNQINKNPYKLSLSIGYAIYKGVNHETEDEFLSRMDEYMYEVKNNK